VIQIRKQKAESRNWRSEVLLPSAFCFADQKAESRKQKLAKRSTSAFYLLPSDFKEQKAESRNWRSEVLLPSAFCFLVSKEVRIA